MKPPIAQVSKSASTGFFDELLHAGVICGTRRPGLLVSNDVGAHAVPSLHSPASFSSSPTSHPLREYASSPSLCRIAERRSESNCKKYTGTSRVGPESVNKVKMLLRKLPEMERARLGRTEITGRL